MKRNIVKGFILIMGLVTLHIAGTDVVFADEIEEIGIAEIIEEVQDISLSYDNELLQVGEGMLAEILSSKGIESASGSVAYSDYLTSIQSESLFLTGGSDDQLILDYISFYLAEVAALQMLDGSNQLEVNAAVEVLNKQTFSEKRLENIESLRASTIKPVINRNPFARASQPSRSFNVKKANEYAARFGLGRNAIDYPTFSNDCTNFASQIAKAGGIGTSNSYTNYAGGYWHPSLLSRNKPWFNASAFFNFFNAEGMQTYGAATKTEVNNLAAAGDMLCYVRRSTGVVDHVAYVNRKTSGKVYITQHTTDRKDEKLDNIDVFGNFNYVLVMKFKTW